MNSASSPPVGAIEAHGSEPAYARFLQRLLALIIYSIILLLILFAALMIATAVRSDNLARPLGFAVAAFWLLYEPLFVAFAGGTLGHIMSNLRVVDDRTHGNVSVRKAVARSIIKGVLGWVSFVTMLTTRRSQAVHDLLTRSTVQVRDISRAGPKLYIRERTELASPALPSRQRRALVILACVAIVSALCFGLGGALAAAGVVSATCIETDRCTRTEDVIFTAIAVVWLAGCIAAIALGWRGYLYGARRQA
jgi:uncharacterized RDD family membrane protein YckC